MIQRKQSLFLLIAAAISALLIYLPVYELLPAMENPADTVVSYSISQNPLLMILNIAIGVFAFFCIFLFKKRNLQIRMCNLLMLLTCLLIGLLFFSADTTSNTMNRKLHYLYGSYLPLLQIVFIFLAMRFIKKDEELVRSAERLR